MGRYHVHRLDANHAAIVEAVRRVGASCEPLGRPVDVAIGAGGLTVLAEIKTARGRLKASQKDFLREWRGSAVILRSVDEALALVAAMREAAACVPGHRLAVLRPEYHEERI